MGTFTQYLDNCGYLCVWPVNMTVVLAMSRPYIADYIYWMEYLKLNMN